MTVWQNRVKIKHLLSAKEDFESIQKSMQQIADELKKHTCFIGFIYIDNFYKIPKGDIIITPLGYANKLIDYLYDFANAIKIWID